MSDTVSVGWMDEWRYPSSCIAGCMSHFSESRGYGGFWRGGECVLVGPGRWRGGSVRYVLRDTLFVAYSLGMSMGFFGSCARRWIASASVKVYIGMRGVFEHRMR